MNLNSIAIQELRNELEQRKGERNRISKSLNSVRKEIRVMKECKTNLEEARIIVQEVAKLTQEELKYRVSDIVSHALSAIFTNPYSFHLEFVLRRDRTEADLFWRRGGNDFLPNGGGVRDVSSFALRLALWTLQTKPTRSVLIMDEPFKYLKPSILQRRAGGLQKEISKKLGIQIIMTTHDTALTEGADKIYEVKIKEGISCVRRAE